LRDSQRIKVVASALIMPTTTPTERVRQFRLRHKTKNDCFYIIRLMTGEDTGSGKYSKYSAGLVCVDEYKRDKWVTTGLVGAEKRKKIKELHRCKIDYTSTRRGYVGVSPPVLVANILREWQGGRIGDLETVIQWKSIRIRGWLGEKGGRGKYYMFHWGNKEYAEENNVPDWKEEDNLFTTFVQDAIDEFAFTITRRFLDGTDENVATREKFLEYYSVLPGMVKTKTAYNQAAHTDFNSWGLIVHLPLSKEGMMLMIWDENREKVGRGEYHYIPFGCYFVLPSHVTHSGVYGKRGNCRFHVNIRRKSDTWQRDEIKTGVNQDTPKNRVQWRPVFQEMKEEASEFSGLYREYLKDNLGGTFREEWVK
jgi:hypothetical protein